MFICRTKTGKTYTEGEEIERPNGKGRLTWDDVPQDVQITVLQISYPFPVRFKKPDGSIGSEFSPKLTIKGFDKYYFMNEAVFVPGAGFPQGELQAKIVAGVDDKAKVILELRMDKWGNVTMNKFPKKRLDTMIKKGMFRKESLRNGI